MLLSQVQILPVPVEVREDGRAKISLSCAGRVRSSVVVVVYVRMRTRTLSYVWGKRTREASIASYDADDGDDELCARTPSSES